MTATQNGGPTEGPKSGNAPNVVEDIIRRFLPFLEIADPILRLASGKNPNVAPVSAVISGVVSSLKKYFSSGKKVNPVALNNIMETIKGVKPKMTKQEADDILAKLKKEVGNLEATK